MPAAVRARRVLHVPRNPAVGWDLAGGSAGDPGRLAGRAALAARYLALELARQEPAGAPGWQVASWMRRHRLTKARSLFSFWAPDAGPDELRARVARIDCQPAAAAMERLVASQLAQARTQRAHPAVQLFRTVDQAAWGPTTDPAGTATTLAAAAGADFAAYLRRLVDTAEVVAGTTTAAVRGGDQPAPWHGGAVCVERPGEQCRVAVQARLAPGLDRGAAAAVLAETLEGADGLLHQRVRAEAAVAYGTVATAPEDGSVVLGITVLRGHLERGVSELRRVVDELDKCELPPDRLAAAAARVGDRVLAKLAEPFGALDDHRQLLAGGPTGIETARQAPAAARQLQESPRWNGGLSRAVGYVGPIDDGIAGLVAALR
jgi:hypothetical protein